jgi:hypothetical protein
MFTSCASISEPVVKPDGNYKGTLSLKDDCTDCIQFLTMEVNLQSNEDTVVGDGSYQSSVYTMPISGYLVNDSIYFQFYDTIGGLTKAKGKVNKYDITGTFTYNFTHLNRFGDFTLFKL